MNEIRFRLEISADQYLRYYRGEANTVWVTSVDGRRICFPANALQKFITRSGVKGSFRITFDDNNKMLGIDRLSF